MGTTCYTTYIFKGKQENVKKLYDDIMKLEGVKNHFCIDLYEIPKLNGDYTEPYYSEYLGRYLGTEMYGNIYEAVYLGDIIEIRSEDRRHPQFQFALYISKKYDLNCFFYGEDEYGNIYTNDTKQEYFTELYKLEIINFSKSQQELKESFIKQGASEKLAEDMLKWIENLEEIIGVPQYFATEQDRNLFLEQRGLTADDYGTLCDYSNRYIIVEKNEVHFVDLI